MNNKVKISPNLILRFLLEISSLVIAGFWAWNIFDGLLRYLLLVLFPLLMATVWGVFNVKDDPSRSGKAPVEVSGLVRLMVELLIFGFATFCLFHLNLIIPATIFLSLIIFHYILSYKRLSWIIKQ